MKRNRMSNKVYLAGVLAVAFAAVTGTYTPMAHAQAAGSASAGQSAAASLPLDRIVTATCRQAWQMGGRNEDGFFAIVKQLAELSAQNRGVTLPDDKAAGARAGQWIRTQALKDPDQLLYAVVDHAVVYSISKGRTTPVGAAKSPATAPPS